MAEGNYREYLKGDFVGAKKYFYVLRPVLACQWILNQGYASTYVVFRVDKSRTASRINRCSESIAGIKMNSPEAKLIKKIPEINEYLDKSILDIKKCSEITGR